MNKTYSLTEARFELHKNPGNVNIPDNKSLYLHFHGAGTILILLVMLLISIHAYPQLGVYKMDPYLNYETQCVPKIDGYQIQQGFDGEYLIHINPAFIQNELFPSNINSFSYKIEVVSFPFFPHSDYNGSDPSDRTMTMPWQSLSYDSDNKSWGWTVFNIYKGVFTQGNSTWSQHSDLVSYVFCSPNVRHDFSESSFIRPYYPHTIHKITIYALENSLVKDSVYWYADNTRGRMNFYPYITDDGGSPAPAYDVHFQPYIELFDGLYFPEDYVLNKNNKMVHGPLLGITGLFFPGYSSGTECQPPQSNMKLAFHLPGTYYKHTYTVDYPFDLTIINPSEKRIFNPSEVEIDLNNNKIDPLIFPSGYTFETIKPFYPLKTELADHENAYMYRDLEDVAFSNNIFAPESRHRSTYLVKSGSKLVIEPCVTIIDADILVEDGGEVVYNANQIYLVEANIMDAQGATNTIIIDNFNFQGTYDCPFNCYKPSNYTPNTKSIEITQNETWTSGSLQNDFGVSGGELIVSGNIIVRSTYELTLDQSVILKFSPNSKIIVEEGAKLTVNGATLTSACTEFWRGIEVWGNKNQSQIPKNQQTGLRIHQGEVQVINGGTIENAINAIWAIKSNSDGSMDWDKTGGVIILDSANLINNNYDVWIGAYHNFLPNNNNNTNNHSSISNSRFENNDNMPEGYNGYAFIGLWDVGTISIKGNSFKNLKTNLSTADRGKGIEAYSATMNLTDYCPSSGNTDDPLSQSQATSLNPTPCQDPVSNHFEGLYYGVWASFVKGFPNSIIHVDRANFENVYHGIYLHNAERASITRCNFKIAATDPNVNYDPDITYAYGLYLDGCNGYRIEEDSFTNYAAYESIYGIVINESGPDNNEIYKNYLDTVSFAIQPQGNNRGGKTTGLGIYCNEMHENYIDIWVLDSGIAQNQLILINNGTTEPYKFAAGNIFTSGFHYDYQHYANTSPIDITYFPDQNNIPIYRYRVNIPQILPLPRSCPSKLANSLLASIEDLNNAKIAFNSAEVMLHIWQDGGNANLEHEVETTLPWDVYVQFNELMSLSPYVSEDVLLAAINNTSFSSLMIKLLMAANTHGINNPEIMQAIYDRVPPLPEEYITEIESGFDLVSQLDLLRADVATTRHLVDILTNDIKRTYQMALEDGEEVLEDYISFLGSINTLSGRYDLAALFLQIGDFQSMDTTLNGTENRFDLSESQLEELQNWQTYFGIASGLKESGIHPNALSQEQIDELETITSLENSAVAPAARALLMFNKHGFDYKEIVKTAPEISLRKGKTDSGSFKTQASTLKVYPNPCNDYIILEYRTGNKYNTLQVELIDATGKTVLTQKLKGGDHDELLGIAGLKPGVYFVRLIGENSLVDIQRITVLR